MRSCPACNAARCNVLTSHTLLRPAATAGRTVASPVPIIGAVLGQSAPGSLCFYKTENFSVLNSHRPFGELL